MDASTTLGPMAQSNGCAFLESQVHDATFRGAKVRFFFFPVHLISFLLEVLLAMILLVLVDSSLQPYCLIVIIR